MADSGATSGLRYMDLPANRNLLINGAMQVAQRGTSVTGISNAGLYNTADRWLMNNSSFGTLTQDIQTDAPAGSGLNKSFRVLVTTPDSSPAATDGLNVQQRLEGQDLQRIKKGTASAEQLTLSFWVKSNATGTYVATLSDQDNTRQVGAQYTISASATWERKTITFPADTTGALDNDNAESLRLFFWLGAGSDRTSGTLRTTWTSTTTADLAVGQTNLAAATNNYWQITGVQLEVGPVATPFEFEPFEATLRKCQRYYWRTTAGSNYAPFGIGVSTSATLSQFIVTNPVTMRVPPTSVDASGLVASDIGSYNLGLTVISIANAGVNESEISTTHVTGATANRIAFLRANNSTSDYLGLNAEL
jgi:hypothetical protein